MWSIFFTVTQALLYIPRQDKSINVQNPPAYNARILKLHADWLLAQGGCLEVKEATALQYSFLAKLIALLPHQLANLKLLNQLPDRDLYEAGAYSVLVALNKAADYQTADRLLQVTLQDAGMAEQVRKLAFPQGLDTMLALPPARITEGLLQLLKMHAQVKAEAEAKLICNGDSTVKAANEQDLSTVYADCVNRESRQISLNLLANVAGREVIRPKLQADPMVKLDTDHCYYLGVDLCKVGQGEDDGEEEDEACPLCHISPSPPSSPSPSPSSSPPAPAPKPEPNNKNAASSQGISVLAVLLPLFLILI